LLPAFLPISGPFFWEFSLGRVANAPLPLSISRRFAPRSARLVVVLLRFVSFHVVLLSLSLHSSRFRLRSDTELIITTCHSYVTIRLLSLTSGLSTAFETFVHSNTHLHSHIQGRSNYMRLVPRLTTLRPP
jgi:hypothetical protein